LTVSDPLPLDDAGFLANPYPVLAKLREQAEPTFSPGVGAWLFSRHADVQALFRDRRLGRVAPKDALPVEAEPDLEGEPFWRVVRNGMLEQDPPSHTRLRKLVAGSFTQARVDALKPRIEAMAVHRVRELAKTLKNSPSEGADFLSLCAEPLAVGVIAELLGLPEDRWESLRPRSADMVAMFEPNRTSETVRRAAAAAAEFSEDLRSLLWERRRAPREDLLTALISAAKDGDVLTEDEVIGTCVLLLNAGHEATVNGAGNSLCALLRHPGLLKELEARGEVPAAAVEELMRFDAPLQLFRRWVQEPLQVAGTTLKPGAQVALLTGAANRDERRFERADELELHRKDNPHLSLGGGIHYCLGAPLARVELQVLLSALVRELPGLSFAEEPKWKPSFTLRGLRALNVKQSSKVAAEP
jgi:cytochrome P450